MKYLSMWATVPMNLSQMVGFIIWLMCLPHLPDDTQPTIGQAAIGVVFT
jgi:hypothetical protein